MLTLVAVCYLIGQTLFSVPDGWTIVEAYSGGNRPYSSTLTLEYCDSACNEQRQKPYVRMTRRIAPGATASVPPATGCNLTASVEAAP